MPGDHLGERQKRALRAFFLNQKGRIDLGRGVVPQKLRSGGDDQIELSVHRLEPTVA
jgi:hypothetical protein